VKALIVLICAASLLQNQAGPSPGTSSQPERVIGVVQTIDLGARRIGLKTDAGSEVDVLFDDSTRFVRVAPGVTDLTNAASIAAADLEIGDRIRARGRSLDSGRLVAASIVVMSKSDIAKKRAAERAEWEKRGIGGVITALDPALNEITINRSAITGAKPLVIALKPGAVLRRYAPDSVRFDQARPCRFEDLQVGDQVKALGDADADGTRLTAEQLVSGSFRNIVGTVVSADPGQNSILITDLVTGRRVQAQLIADTALHRLPPEVARMMAVRLEGGGSRSEPSRQGSNGDLQSAIELLPSISTADVKTGEAVILACTSSTDPVRLTVITLLAGVEPLLRASSRGGRPLDLGAWNLDLNMNVGAP
jgi:hypothetical protein